MIKRRVTLIVIIITIVVLVSAIYNIRDAVSLNWLQNHERSPLLSSVSPDNTISLIVEYESASFFGPSSVYVYYENSSNRIRKMLINTSISNDGKDLSRENCNIAWNGRVAFITLRGEEQSDAVYKADLSNGVTVVKLK